MFVWAPYPTSLIVLSDTHMRERERGREIPWDFTSLVRVVTVGASTSVLRANGSAKRRPCPLSANPMDRSNYCVHDVTNYWSMRNAWHGDWTGGVGRAICLCLWNHPGRPAGRPSCRRHARTHARPSLPFRFPKLNLIGVFKGRRVI